MAYCNLTKQFSAFKRKSFLHDRVSEGVAAAFDVFITSISRFADDLALWGSWHLAPGVSMPDIRISPDFPGLPIRLLGWFEDPEDDSRWAVVRYRNASRYLLSEAEWLRLVSPEFKPGDAA